MAADVPSTLSQGMPDPRTESTLAYLADMRSVDASKLWRVTELLGPLGCLLEVTDGREWKAFPIRLVKRVLLG